MQLRVRTVDAFTAEPFRGNPAGVVRLDEFGPSLTDRECAAIAAELNLSETAFLFGADTVDTDFRLRWFTPTVEVDLCGHATLAMSHCLFADGRPSPIRYATRSGVLTVRQAADGRIVMDFPAQPPMETALPPQLADALGAEVRWCGQGGGDYLIEVADADTVRKLRPDLATIAALPARGVIVTAGSDDDSTDFVSRFFAPAVGVPEDPVTGSAHTALGPYWAAKLGRTELAAHQVSERGGRIDLLVGADRVELTGQAVTMLDGTLTVRAG